MLVQSTSFEKGGAAIAAKRWVEALEIEPIKCQSATAKHSVVHRIANRISTLLFWSDELFSHRGPLSLDLVGRAKSRDSKAYFTHWVQNGFLSLYRLSLQSRRTIWYLHDEWLLLGLGHYGSGSQCDSTMPAITRLVNFIVRKWKFRYLVRPALGICVPSLWMKGQLVKSGISSDRIKVIPNPIPEFFFNPPAKAAARRDLNLGADQRIVLVIASSTILDKRKGIDLVEPTMKQMQQSNPNFLLITVGILGIDFTSQGLNHKAWGHVESERDLLNLYASADVLFLPSRLDNLPQVVTEAQSVGLPVVAFDVGGVSEAILFPGLSGRLVPPFSVEKAAESIACYLDASNTGDRHDRISEASKRWSGSRIKIDFSEYLTSL